MSMFRVWAPVGLRALAWLALTVSLASLAKYVYIPASWYTTLGIRYPYGFEFEVWAWTGRNSGRLVLGWGPLLLAALLTIASSVFAPVDRPKWWTNNTYKVRMRWPACQTI